MTLEKGKYYKYNKYGRALLIGHHPEDGACLIIEVYYEREDTFRLHYCEASDLEELGEEHA